ncbi:MAG: metallophosphoesterase [Anaerolineaceae bacterium]|nr:metallophosphoesterase [Anaerolineaceae bacterium]
MRLAWLTDIHLNFLSPVQTNRFFATLKEADADAFLITGDIAEAPTVSFLLRRFETKLLKPVYFVLGNHDFYGGTIVGVHEVVGKQAGESRWLTWLNDAGVVHLSDEVGLVGHDGWADGRSGDYENSPVEMTDYYVIEDFDGLDKARRLEKLHQLGDATAAHLRQWLPRALATHPQVICALHVPPFREACWHQGQVSNDDFLPHFCCQAAGEVLVEIMKQHPERELTVLCGHTHGEGEAQILPNLRVLTGGAEYGDPRIQQIFEC